MTNPKSLSTPVAYTIPDFCRTYAVGRTTVYRLIDEGAIVARKAGRRTLIDADSAARWYASLPVGAQHDRGRLSHRLPGAGPGGRIKTWIGARVRYGTLVAEPPGYKPAHHID